MEFMHRFKLWCKEKYLFENIYFDCKKRVFQVHLSTEMLSSLSLLGYNIWTYI